MIGKTLTAVDGVPIAIAIMARQCLESVAQMLRCPFVVGIEEGDEAACGRHVIKTGIARTARSRIGLADDRNARPLVVSERLKFTYRRERRFIIDDKDIEILKHLLGYRSQCALQNACLSLVEGNNNRN